MTDVAYYQRRLSEELAAIGRANCSQAAAVHRELADIYRVLIDGDGEQNAARAERPWPDAAAHGEQDHVGTGII